MFKEAWGCGGLASKFKVEGLWGLGVQDLELKVLAI